MQPTETQNSISQWIDATFGTKGNLYSTLTRANEEMAELLRAVAEAPTYHGFWQPDIRDKALNEAADVAICLYRIADRMNVQVAYDADESSAVYPLSAANAANSCLARMMSFAGDLKMRDDVSDYAQMRAPSLVYVDRFQQDLLLVYQNLAALCRILNSKLEDRVDHKMTVNRARTWNLTDDGQGYHVKGGVPSDHIMIDRLIYTYFESVEQKFHQLVGEHTITSDEADAEIHAFIARVAHAVNRAYCQALGDTSQLHWNEAPSWQKDSAINGVKFHLDNPDATPADTHESWLAQKLSEGWTWGPVKDPEKKQHPCCCPYNELPSEQRAKDYLFKGVVDVMSNPEL